MTINVNNYLPANLKDLALYNEITDIIQFILGKGELQLATSYNNAVTDIPIVVDITDSGTGIHTLESSLSKQSDVFTVDVSTDIITLSTFLDLEPGTKVRLTNSGGSLPSGLSIDTNYYVSKTDAIATYIDIKNKYKDFLSLDDETVRKIISEFGYDYIAEILKLLKITAVDNKIFLGYLSLIHFFKGHRNGLELVFGILKLDHIIVEWWQKTPQGTVDTYDLTIDVDVSNPDLDFDDIDPIKDAIEIFAPQYVYPTFDTFIVQAAIKVQNPLYLGVVGLYGEETILYPPITRTITVQSPIPFVAMAIVSGETTTIYPP